MSEKVTGSDWVAVYEVRLAHMLNHDEPDAEKIVRQMLDDESVTNFADWPNDFRLVRLYPDTAKDAGIPDPSAFRREAVEVMKVADRFFREQGDNDTHATMIRAFLAKYGEKQ